TGHAVGAQDHAEDGSGSQREQDRADATKQGTDDDGRHPPILP
ncbi:MAG: hypothetical protein Q605_AUC00850G0002, partial [Actinomyces urogenitalis DORA_12]